MRSIKMQGDYPFNRVGVCDLDGDGVFDYVIKLRAPVTGSIAADRQSL